MFVLRLRSVYNPEEIMAVARSDGKDAEQKLWDYISSQLCPPYMETKGQERVIKMFKKGSELENFMPPNPGQEGIGVIDFGTVEDRVREVVAEAVIHVEKQVRDEWEKLIGGTLEV